LLRAVSYQGLMVDKIIFFFKKEFGKLNGIRRLMRDL